MQTQWISGNLSPILQWPDWDEWHARTKSEMTASARNRTRISRSQVSTLYHWTIPDCDSGVQVRKNQCPMIRLHIIGHWSKLSLWQLQAWCILYPRPLILLWELLALESLQIPCKHVGDVILVSEGKRPILRPANGAPKVLLYCEAEQESTVFSYMSKFKNARNQTGLLFHPIYKSILQVWLSTSGSVYVIEMSADWSPEDVDPSCYIFSSERR